MNAIDLPALRGLLAETSAEIAALKKLLRRTWTRPMAAEQKTLCSLKRRATELCVLRALLRGRYHLAGPPRGIDATSWDRHAHHQAVADRAADRYQLLLPTSSDLTCA